MPIIVLLTALIALLCLYAIAIFNRLVKGRNLVKEGWSTIDVMLKKRHDLVPNLVETVKGYAAHERGTLEAVTQARSQAMGAASLKDKELAESGLGRALVSLLAVAERYPELKANTNFQQLQENLASLENDLERARRYYNGTARDQNTLIESFPSNIVAGAFKFTQAAYFELDSEAERAVPHVKF